MARKLNRILRVSAILVGGVYAIGTGGCGTLLQQNVEALLAPQVLSTGFALPFTWIFQVLSRLFY